MNTKNKKRGKAFLSVFVLAAVILTMMGTTLTAFADTASAVNYTIGLNDYKLKINKGEQQGGQYIFTCSLTRPHPIDGDPNANATAMYQWQSSTDGVNWENIGSRTNTATLSVDITPKNSGSKRQYRCLVDAYSTAIYEYMNDAYSVILGRDGEKGGLKAWGEDLMHVTSNPPYTYTLIDRMQRVVNECANVEINGPFQPPQSPMEKIITNEVAAMAAAIFISNEWMVVDGRAYGTTEKHGIFNVYRYDVNYNKVFLDRLYAFANGGDPEHPDPMDEAAKAIYNEQIKQGDTPSSQCLIQTTKPGGFDYIRMPIRMVELIKEVSANAGDRQNKIYKGTGNKCVEYDNMNGRFNWGKNRTALEDTTTLVRHVYADAVLMPIITYSVAFNGNDGSGSMAPMSMIANVPKKLTQNGFTRTGYAFAGWRDKDGNNYADEQPVNNLTTTDGATVTVNAQWKANGYNIVFNGNGADSGSTAPMSMTYGDVEKALTKNGFTRTGYTFAGWATNNQGGVVYGDQAPVRNLTATNGATINLYAKWTPIKYTINFEGNGATGGSAPPKMPMAYDTAKNLPSNTFVRNGYTFAGWELNGKNYAVNASVKNLTTKDGATVTFLAQWKANGYNIVFDGNGADSGSTARMSMTYDVPKALTKNGFTKDEYMFTGWARSSNGAVEFNDEQEVRNLGTSGTVTLYAQWRYTPQLSGTRYFMVPTYLGTKQHPQSDGIKDYDVWFTAKRSQSESFFAKHVLHADEKVVIKGKITVPVGGKDPDPYQEDPEEIHTTIPQDPKK